MKFVLPTQSAPKEKIKIGDIEVSSNKRVEINLTQSSKLYLDSMTIESDNEDWGKMNELIIFHTFIFNDLLTLNWYESEDFESQLQTNTSDCIYLIDYSDISSKIYFPDDGYKTVQNYKDLYNKYISLEKNKRDLIKNYLNSTESPNYISLNRQIRNGTFWRIVTLFSIIEEILGKNEYCTEKVTCGTHGELFPHHKYKMKEWLDKGLSKIVGDKVRGKEYLDVIWLAREEIRNKAVHSSMIPGSSYVLQQLGEITWDWSKTKSEWKKDQIALFNLELQIRTVVRNLLLTHLFEFNYFPELRSLHSRRIVS